MSDNCPEKSGSFYPGFTTDEVTKIVNESYGLQAVSVKQLGGYIDQNFLLKTNDGKKFIFKISNAQEDEGFLDAQLRVLSYLSGQNKNSKYPIILPTLKGELISTIKIKNDNTHYIRLLNYLEGKFLAHLDFHPPELLEDLGSFLGNLDKKLKLFSHPATHRYIDWDLKNALDTGKYSKHIEDPLIRNITEYFLFQFEMLVLPVLKNLRTSIIHNDANDYNLLVGTNPPDTGKIAGIIDFGDMVYTYTIFELAIALAYAMLDKPDPLNSASFVIKGYNNVFPLKENEIDLMFCLICTRLSVSLCMSAWSSKVEPGNEYIKISEKPVIELIKKLAAVNPVLACHTFREACNMPALINNEEKYYTNTLKLRDKHIGKALSISYKNPLKIIRGTMQYLFDDKGNSYLDCVNNVCHVGHCHPKVVKAAQQQIAILNTNTRYLHDNLGRYAEKLCSTLPDPLNVCYFVCTGSEANDLALRIARTHTKNKDIIVVDSAYHGNTASIIEISPYKFDRPGGPGAQTYIHKIPTPDLYRGKYRYGDPDAGKKYAKEVQSIIEKLGKEGKKAAAFICESLLGCAGQIILPDGFLKEAYQFAGKAGVVCIADEVQVGFGRVGTHYWGFETQDVIPDIVTFGKPIGNGHPLAAVVTTPEIAGSFNNGMEYFNTFGGNPVSCAIGMAVLDVIEDEKLMENALKTGAHMKGGLEWLKGKYMLIGDVRGAGLFIGVELVKDRKTQEPAQNEAEYIIEKMKEKGILLSTDGPLENVLKIKPPIVFSKENADHVIEELDKVLSDPELELL